MYKIASFILIASFLGACSKESNAGGDSAAAATAACPNPGSKLSLTEPSLLKSLPQWMQDEVEGGLKMRGADSSGLSIRPYKIIPGASSNKVTLNYLRSGLPFCRIFGRMDDIEGKRFYASDEGLLLTPAVDPVWENSTKGLEAAMAKLSIQGQGTITEEERCWWDAGDQLVPAWSITAETDEGTITAFVNGNSVYAAAPKRFDLEGSAKIYQQNNTGPLVDVPLHNLDATGVLKNTQFEMITPSGDRAPQESTGVFAYDPTDSRFSEVSLFTNITLMAEWFAKFTAKKSLDCNFVRLSPFIKGELNNGYYSPATSSTTIATIFMAKGDGTNLQNLQTDADPVAHELGHHVVYRAVTDVSDYTTVVIHEGLADFFVYARTGNACLGETICPARSTMCAKVGQCLRSGENVLKFTDGGLSKTAHLRSQVLSGMLWDIGKKIGLEKTGLIAFTAVDYLLPRSTYVDLTLGLMKADLELNKGVNSCLILEEAKNRALDSSLANVNCNDYVAP